MNDEVVHEFLTRWRDEVQIIFCLGNNDKGREEMENNPGSSIRTSGFWALRARSTS